MGSAPPHIALISGLEATGLAGEEIAARLRRVASAHAPVSGRVLAKCKVTQNGCVLVGVECPGSLAIARALSSALPGADTYYASQHPEQQLITLGRFAGVDAVGFAEWLSESLAGQRALLPEFTCVSVQLSDEAHPFPNPQIPLTGMASTAVGGGALDSGLGLGLNLGVGLGLGGGFGGSIVGTVAWAWVVWLRQMEAGTTPRRRWRLRTTRRRRLAQPRRRFSRCNHRCRVRRRHSAWRRQRLQVHHRTPVR